MSIDMVLSEARHFHWTLCTPLHSCDTVVDPCLPLQFTVDPAKANAKKAAPVEEEGCVGCGA